MARTYAAFNKLRERASKPAISATNGAHEAPAPVRRKPKPAAPAEVNICPRCGCNIRAVAMAMTMAEKL
jgi:hypothetical protein